MGPAVSHRISRVLRYSGYLLNKQMITYTGLSPPLTVLSMTFYFSLSDRYASPSTPVRPEHDWFGLVRVRSPLLAQSLLFSLPAGNEMFQFPAFASPVKGMSELLLTGCPIRISSDQRLFAPPRSFSQLITSFVASKSQGIHRLPLYSLFIARLSQGTSNSSLYE